MSSNGGERASLEASDLEAGYGARRVVAHLSIAIERGTITALVGPNGSGKSTLLKTLGRLLHPSGGAVYLDGRSIAALRTAEVARRIAVLPQSPPTPAGITVRTLVEQGRYAHVGPLRMLHRQDHEAIDEALRLTGMGAFAGRLVESLSGGERQRAWIALALAQAADVLLLDEPTTFLDIRHQLEVLALIRRLNVERGITIVMVLHDLDQAARFAHRIVAMTDGRIVADGTPRAVITPEIVSRVFGVDVLVLPHPETGVPLCVARDTA